MRKAVLGSVVAAALCGWCPPALGQSWGKKGSVTLSVERVFGLHWMHTEITNPSAPPSPSNPSDRTLTVFGIGWYRSETAYHNPRAAIDFFITDNLSLGGAIGLYAWGSDGDRQGFLIAPRIGYAVRLSDRVGLWPRGGFTYFSEEPAGGGANYTQFALSGEAMFAFLFQDSWAILAGPTLDLGLAGGVGDANFRQHSLGLAIGLMGIL